MNYRDTVHLHFGGCSGLFSVPIGRFIWLIRTFLGPIAISGEPAERVDLFKCLHRAHCSHAKEVSAATACSSKVASFQH